VSQNRVNPAPAGPLPDRRPDRFDPATAEMLAVLDAASDVHAKTLRPANTTKAYASDWKTWTEFTAEKNLPVDAATRGTFRGFVAWLWQRGGAPTTIDRKLTGTVVTLRREHHVVVNPDDVLAARELLRDYVSAAAEKQEAPRGRGQAPALLLPDLRKVAAACPLDTLAGLRDRALVLIAFAIAARRSEPAGLCVRDIQDDPNGLVVDVRVSKTRPRTVAVAYGSNPTTCPVRAWRAWAAAAGIAEDPGAPAFQHVDRHGRMLGAMTGQAVGQAVTRAGTRAGLTIKLTGHSVRAGLATEARRAGKSREAIAATTGHVPSSPVLDKYLREVDRWDPAENAGMGIGL